MGENRQFVVGPLLKNAVEPGLDEAGDAYSLRPGHERTDYERAERRSR